MRIGLDFDGVVAGTITAMVTYARERLGLEGYRRLVAETHETAYSLTFQPTEGALDALLELTQNHELFVVTAREGASFANAHAWIEQNGTTRCFVSLRSSLGRPSRRWSMNSSSSGSWTMCRARFETGLRARTRCCGTRSTIVVTRPSDGCVALRDGQGSPELLKTG